LRWDTVKCWNESFDEIEKYSLRDGDIVIGMDGSRVGKNRAQIRKEDLPLILAQRVARVRAKENFSQDFLAYIIKGNSFERYIDTIKTGTSIPHISPQQIKEFEFHAPSKETQHRIASILSSLDDAIELNQQTNKTLEEMAKSIFKEMCLPKEDMPEGWRVGKLGDIYKTTSGGTPSRAKMEYYENGAFQWIKSKELNNTFIIETEEKITAEALKNSSAKILPPYSY
jgi:type I restriction enzyme S subunit